MEHSIAGRYQTRSVARFPRGPIRTRERRLGLRAISGFSAAPRRLTVLHRPQPGALARLRADWRAITPTPRPPRASGLVGRVGGMTWTRSVPTRRPAAPSVPWHG